MAVNFASFFHFNIQFSIRMLTFYLIALSFKPSHIYFSDAGSSFYYLNFSYDRQYHYNISATLFVQRTLSGSYGFFISGKYRKLIFARFLRTFSRFNFHFTLFLLLLIALLLLLSGDVEQNPGPDSCHVCNEVIVAGLRDTLECDMCELLLHKRCTFLSDADFRTFSKPEITWICNGCKPHLKSSAVLRSLSDSLAQFTLKFSDLDSKLESNSNSISLINQRMDACESRLRELSENRLSEVQEVDQSGLLSSITNVVQGQLRISLEEKNRESGLVLFGVIEDSTNIDNDESIVRELFETLSMKYIAGSIVLKRLGTAASNLTRPLLITLPSVSLKWNLFSRRFLLKESNSINMRSISMVPDRSLRQRIIAKKLRKELIMRRSNQEDVVIYKGNIINRSDLPRNLNGNIIASNVASGVRDPGSSSVNIVASNVACVCDPGSGSPANNL